MANGFFHKSDCFFFWVFFFFIKALKLNLRFKNDILINLKHLKHFFFLGMKKKNNNSNISFNVK